MTMENFAPLMFGGLVVVLLIGFPVAFSLSALGVLCGFIAIEMGWFPPEFMAALPLNVFGILSNELLLAIPFFTLMGSVLEKCGLAEDMLDSMGQLGDVWILTPAEAAKRPWPATQEQAEAWLFDASTQTWSRP